MNLFKKAFCRIFHIACKIIKPFLPYNEPVLLNGIDEIPNLLKQNNKQSVLLVTDHQLYIQGITHPLEELLQSEHINCVIYDKTNSNPTVHNVEEAKKLYLEHGCQCMIALGGGSAMDCAKAVGACVVRPNKKLEQLKGTLRVLKRIPLLIAIPTTAGTGSEATPAAVITDSETRHKYTVNDFSLTPHYAVLDPKITYTLPPFLTATTGMDALTHAVEAYIGCSTNKKSRENALEATRLIFQNIEKAYCCGTDYEARSNMLKAAYLAGVAFSISYVGYIHATAHPLGGHYNIPHGLANSVLMPFVLEEYGKAAHKKLHEMAIAAGVSVPSDTHAEGAAKFIKEIRELNARMNIPDTLTGIKKEDIPRMAGHADREANPLYPVPLLMDKEKLEQFYYKVADWRDEQ